MVIALLAVRRTPVEADVADVFHRPCNYARQKVHSNFCEPTRAAGFGVSGRYRSASFDGLAIRCRGGSKFGLDDVVGSYRTGDIAYFNR